MDGHADARNLEMAITAEQCEALRMLSESTGGCTVPILLARGGNLRALSDLVSESLATVHRESVPGARKMRFVMRLRITDAGRRALAL
jgi:hypothetical protein